MTLQEWMDRASDDLHSLAVNVGRLADFFAPITGIVVHYDEPFSRKETAKMTTTFTRCKKSDRKPRAAAGAKATGGSFAIQDNEDGTFTVFGTTASGQQVDISSVATLTAASDAPAVLEVDAPVGMTCGLHGLTPGNVNLTVTATWNDGSIGPFTFVESDQVTAVADPVTGLQIVHGPATVR